jgi:hypothetical protein
LSGPSAVFDTSETRTHTSKRMEVRQLSSRKEEGRKAVSKASSRIHIQSYTRMHMDCCNVSSDGPLNQALTVRDPTSGNCDTCDIRLWDLDNHSQLESTVQAVAWHSIASRKAIWSVVSSTDQISAAPPVGCSKVDPRMSEATTGVYDLNRMMLRRRSFRLRSRQRHDDGVSRKETQESRGACAWNTTMTRAQYGRVGRRKSLSVCCVRVGT